MDRIRYDKDLLKVLQEKEKEEDGCNYPEKREFIRLCLKYHICPICHIGMDVRYDYFYCSTCDSSFHPLDEIISIVNRPLKRKGVDDDTGEESNSSCSS